MTATFPESRSRLPILPDRAPSDVGARVQLLGGFGLFHYGTAASTTPATGRLIAYLAFRRTVCREAVCAALWPDSPPERAAANLRSTLWRINRNHPPLLRVAAGALALHVEVEVDAHLLARSARTLIGPPAADRTAASYRLAMDRTVDCDGELLSGWYDDWVLLERERLRQLRLHALEAAALQLCDDGRYGQAIDVAFEVVRIDPLRESAHRAVIHVHLREGNVAAAVRRYEELTRVLRVDLGIDPSPEITAMVAPWLPR